MFTHEALAYERMYLVFSQRAATQCFSEKNTLYDDDDHGDNEFN